MHPRVVLAALAGVVGLLVAAAPAEATHSADFTCSPSCTVQAGSPITYTAQTTAKDETVQSYEWDLDGDKTTGKDGFETVTQGKVTEPRSYSVPGVYTIRVRITVDEFGDIHPAQAEKEITITEPPPTGVPGPTFTAGPSTAGGLTRFDASQSAVVPGRQIVSYLWDFNGDRRIDANTGSNPFAEFRFRSGGNHSVGLQVQDSTGAFSEMYVGQIQTNPEAPGCRSVISLGFLEIAASCIRRDGDRWVAELTSGASIDGVEVVSGPGAELYLDTGGSRWRLGATGTVKVQLTNTPVGDITLFQRDLRSNPIEFGAGANRSDPGAPGLLLGSFRVDHSCGPSGPTEVCATLPGGFPLTGSVSLYLTPPEQDGLPGMLVAANAELSRPFPVTGDVGIAANLDTGPQIDSFSFEVGRIDAGVARLNRLELGYERRDDNGDLDVWEGGVDASLTTPVPAGLEGDFRFANGRFNRASFRIRGLRVLVGPGIFLNSFGATLGIDPFRLGGTLGVGFGPVDATGEFLYENTNPDHIHVGGNFSLLGAELARAAIDYWTNGDLEFLGEFHYGFPNRTAALILVDGGVRGWFQQQPVVRFQVEGDVSVSIPILAGRAAVLVNSEWIAGCGQVQGRIPFHGDPYATWGPTLAGYLAFRHTDGRLEGGFGSCDLGPYRLPGPRGAQAGGARVVRLPAGLPGVGFEISSAQGLPAVRIDGPGGQSFTTPSTPAPPSRQGRFLQVGAAGQNQLFVYIKRPARGRWTITPLDGSPAITGLRQANQLPKPRVRARVTGKGRRRTLVYSVRRIAGQRVVFREDGSDTNSVIGTAKGTRGRIRFTPSEGRGRARRIFADITLEGRPRDSIVAGRYRAPKPLAPTRPARARARRRGARVILTWGRSRGAASYTVAVRGSDGRRNQFATSRRRRRLAIAPVPPSVRLNVTIRGEAKSGRPGKARKLRVKPAPRRRGRRR